MLSRQYEVRGRVAAPAAEVFAHLDDHTRLSSHMSKSSWKMGGGKMQIDVDEQGGKAVGSHIRLSGRILGRLLSVEEVVTEREPPIRKVWETIGTPDLLVIGPYRMGFDITPAAGQSVVRVFIDYALPEKGAARTLGRLCGDWYAKWCTRQMLRDVAAHFSTARSGDEVRTVQGSS
jgi:polyketide cyclase/dehydrase/lipid transport protein